MERSGSTSGLTVAAILWLNVSTSDDADPERSGECVDEKIEELVLVDYIVRLGLFGHNPSSGLVQLASFERLVFVCGCGRQYRTVRY
jgi:hypothetical protein